jgi:hypothetical protein
MLPAIKARNREKQERQTASVNHSFPPRSILTTTTRPALGSLASERFQDLRAGIHEVVVTRSRDRVEPAIASQLLPPAKITLLRFTASRLIYRSRPKGPFSPPAQILGSGLREIHTSYSH